MFDTDESPKANMTIEKKLAKLRPASKKMEQ